MEVWLTHQTYQEEEEEITSFQPHQAESSVS